MVISYDLAPQIYFSAAAAGVFGFCALAAEPVGTGVFMTPSSELLLQP